MSPPRDDAARPPGSLPRAIKIWFWLDALVALSPPLYWAADGRTAPILGIPTALFYFIAVGVFITASVAAAWLVDHAAGEMAG